VPELATGLLVPLALVPVALPERPARSLLEGSLLEGSLLEGSLPVSQQLSLPEPNRVREAPDRPS
jgi:hypothetical protein